MGDDRNPAGLLRSARAVGDHYVPDHPYFAHAEPSMDWVWDELIWPMIRACDLGYVVDLAAGHGRNTRKFLEAGAGTVLALDIQPGNVAVCAERFRGIPGSHARSAAATTWRRRRATGSAWSTASTRWSTSTRTWSVPTSPRPIAA